jgi:type IV secretory pathway VirB4 component
MCSCKRCVSRRTARCLVIEEAWKAIASPLMAEYIKFMYKTARKFWASVGVVTQEIQDIIGSEIVKEAIINNSDVVMLLDQSKFRERFDTIKAILGLTDVDCKKDIHHQPIWIIKKDVHSSVRCLSVVVLQVVYMAWKNRMNAI